MMMSFHFPPIAASAAVSGQSLTGLRRRLPESSFWSAMIASSRLDRMIVEVRKYTIKPGWRGKFIEFFETRAVPALREHGMEILGPMLDLENPDVFVFLRGFPSL